MNTKSILAAFAALGCAVAAQADVSSSNIVGYNSTKLIEGQQMISASFIGVGSDQTYWVSDLKISGYENDPMYANWDVAAYDANFFILDFAGRCLNETNRKFNYHDDLDSDDPIAWVGGTWLNNGAEITPHGENDYQLQAGDAFWFQGQSYTDGYQPVLGTSGQVISEDMAYATIEGQNGIGNNMSAPVWVSDLTIEGYQEDPMYANWDVAAYDANFFILDFAGRCLNEKNRKFNYHDDFDSDDPIAWVGGAWLNNGAAITPHGENDFQLQPGMGIWFAGQAFTPDVDNKYQPYLVFPTAVK